MSVQDDGIGIRDTSGGNGLVNMSIRAADRGGVFEVTPIEPYGTLLTWTVPLPVVAAD